MAGNNIGTRPKQAMTVDAYMLVFKRRSYTSTVLAPSGLFPVIAACQPVEAPGGRTLITEVLEHVAVLGGQQQATKHANAADAAD